MGKSLLLTDISTIYVERNVFDISTRYVDSNDINSRDSSILRPLLDSKAKDISVIVNCIVICGLISVLGIIANIINLFIFFKQGFENTMNISLSGVALADLCTLVSMLWYDVCICPEWDTSDTPIAFSEVLYLTAGWPNCIFSRISCVIIVFMTAERCLCVLIPLTVKSVITKTKTFVIVLVIFVTQMMTTIPTYYSTYIDWKFFPAKNRSLLGLKRISNWEPVESITFFLQSTMQSASFVLLMFFTALLVVNLKRKSKWRASSTSGSQQASISTRDRKSVKMVVLIAGILIACFTPGLICFTAMAFEPEFTIGGFYDNIFFLVGSFTFICQTLNSGVNIFIYYNMSSNYRDSFLESFSSCGFMFSANKQITSR